MISISPTPADLTAAAPCAAAAGLFGMDLVIREPEVDLEPAPTKAESFGPADIPYYDAPCESYPSKPAVPLFKHVPLITRRVGDRIEVVTGPVEPVIPHTDVTTEQGWKRFFGGKDAAKAAALAAAKAVSDERAAFYQARDDEAERVYKARCDAADAKGKPHPARPKKKTYAERCAAADLKGKPHPQAVHNFEDHCSPEHNKHIQGSRDAAKKELRLKRGRIAKGEEFADRKYDTVTEVFTHADGTPAPAIRGWLGLLTLELINSALPKRSIQFGYDKTAEHTATRADRIWAVDHAYIVLDKARRCLFVQDIDGWWPSLQAFRADLRKYLPLKYMPAGITYRGREEDGLGVENPHLTWPLPPGSRVIKGKRLAQQVKLHAMIQKSICSLLIPLGADPGHTNTFKTKSPLSPGWSVEVCDDYFVTMNEWRAFLPAITPNDHEMRRRAKTLKVAKDTGIEVTLSDAIWHDGVSERRIAIRSAQATKDPAFLSAVRKRKNCLPFVDWLYNADGVVTQRLIAIHKDTSAVRAVLAAQRQFVIELNLIPSEVGNFCDRGRDARKNADLAPLPRDACKDMRKARRDLLQNLGRQRTQENKLDVHLGLIAEEIEARLQAGVPVVKKEVVKALIAAGTVGRSTAYNRFDYALYIVQRSARYQVSLSSDIQAQPVATAEAAPVTTSEPVTVASGTPDPVNYADRPLPDWVVCKHTLIEYEDACHIRDHWRVAVAAWRSSQARKRPAAGVDLAEDPVFRAMVLDQSAWGRRRH